MEDNKAKSQEDAGVLAFTFGEPEPVLDKNLCGSLGCNLLDNGRYYSTPLSWDGLARLRGANAYHGSLLEFKTNQIIKDAVFNDAVTFAELLPFITDFVTFKNAYLQKIRNRAGQVAYLKHVPAINVRRMKGVGLYCYIEVDRQITEFKEGEIIHIKNYDVGQSIYGMPSYIGAIQSMLLNEDATLFRRRYYQNGAHVGYIFYSSAADIGEDEQNAIKKAVQSSKKVGNFSNLFLHIPNGREKDIQIIPVGDFSTRDELEKIKNISRDDIIAAHRIPPALASVIPSGITGSGVGDIEKANAVYMENEVRPERKFLLQINNFLNKNKHLTFVEKAE